MPAAAHGAARARWNSVNYALFGFLPALLAVFYLSGHHGHLDAFDFHREFWPAGHRVLQGLSPYGWSWMDIRGDIAFPYPAFTAILFVPLALINHALADLLFTVLSLAALLMTLWVLNVRDWRLYGLALIWSPVIGGLHDANVTFLLALVSYVSGGVGTGRWSPEFSWRR
jgi:Glycosyltransferase family 87